MKTIKRITTVATLTFVLSLQCIAGDTPIGGIFNPPPPPDPPPSSTSTTTTTSAYTIDPVTGAIIWLLQSVGTLL